MKQWISKKHVYQQKANLRTPKCFLFFFKADWKGWSFEKKHVSIISHRIHVWYIYLHLVGCTIFTYIYHNNQPNVGKYTSPMDPMGIILGVYSNFGNMSDVSPKSWSCLQVIFSLPWDSWPLFTTIWENIFCCTFSILIKAKSNPSDDRVC